MSKGHPEGAMPKSHLLRRGAMQEYGRSLVADKTQL